MRTKSNQESKKRRSAIFTLSIKVMSFVLL